MKLKDYLGTIIAEVNQARVLADVESARIAQAYSEDELLKHFPVPRFRAQDIELDIPFAIEGFDAATSDTDDEFRPIDKQYFNAVSYTTMKDVAKVRSFNRNISDMINKRIAENSRKLESHLKTGIEVETAFDQYENQMGKLFLDVLRQIKSRIRDKDEAKLFFEKSLREKLLHRVEKEQTSKTLNNANIIVEAHKLREIPSENVLRVKMKLFEEGMEWHNGQDEEGNVTSKLLPE